MIMHKTELLKAKIMIIVNQNKKENFKALIKIFLIKFNNRMKVIKRHTNKKIKR